MKHLNKICTPPQKKKKIHLLNQQLFVGNKTELQFVLKCSKCSETAIIEMAQPMNHRDIASTVDSTCAFRVAGEVISGVSYYSVFFEFGT